MRLENKVALITGGYGGMGRASARLFSKEGAQVFVAGSDHPRGDALVEEINAAGGNAHFVALDVVNQTEWDAAVEQVKKEAGTLHVLMNIVGSNALVRFPEVDIDEWNKIFEINVTGTLRGIQTCAPLIQQYRRRFDCEHRLGRRHHRELRHRLLSVQVGPGRPLALGGVRVRRLGYSIERHSARMD